MVQFHEIDLSIGDVLRVGELTVTVIDIDQGEVSIRIDDGFSHEEETTFEVDQNAVMLPR